MILSLVKAKVGFEVEWRLGWDEPPSLLRRLGRPAKHGEAITVFPKDEFPANHPIALMYGDYFK